MKGTLCGRRGAYDTVTTAPVPESWYHRIVNHRPSSQTRLLSRGRVDDVPRPSQLRTAAPQKTFAWLAHLLSSFSSSIKKATVSVIVCSQQPANLLTFVLLHSCSLLSRQPHPSRRHCEYGCQDLLFIKRSWWGRKTGVIAPGTYSGPVRK